MANPEHLEILNRGADAWNKWRSDNPSIQPDLRDAHLRGRNLDGANLSQVNLSGALLKDASLGRASLDHAKLDRANLGGANLTSARLRVAFLGTAKLNYAKFDHANLCSADLCSADLNGASFFNTILDGADLSYANLSCAKFQGAYLRGTRLDTAYLRSTQFGDASLSEAELFQTVFIDVDLSYVRGLTTVFHQGPSIIDTSTLTRSQGTIPKAFLRGCGLKEWEVEVTTLYRPDLPPGQIVEILYKVNELRSDPFVQFYSCFISYSYADKSFARRLHDALQRRGVRCWLDEYQILPGQDIMDEVNRGISLSDKVLLCCSKASLKSWWVDNEINVAFEKERALMRQRGEKVLALIPLNLDGYLHSGSWHSGKAAQVKTRLAADFTGWERNPERFEAEFERLVRVLRVDAGGREPPPRPKL